MGFTRDRAQKALSLKKNNFDEAMNWLLDNPEIMDVSEEDQDLLFARKLQQEEEKKRQAQGIVCQMTGKKVPESAIFILDDCSHRFEKTALTKYVSEAVCTSVNITCPLKGCNAHISVRDVTALMPTSAKGMTPKVSSKQATQRIASELKCIIISKPDTQGYSVNPIKDNLYHWEVKFFGFDPKEPLAQDLKALKRDCILLHITFPSTYPLHPPFCRILKPRFAFRTGHVTIGGSICTELLTTKGWTPANTVEAVIISIRAQFLEGGARLDMSNKKEYTESEAKEAYDRMVETHGWR